MLIEVASDEGALVALWADWQALWRSTPGALPFLAPAWLRPWWDAFGTGRPMVAILRSATGLGGVLALYELGGKLLPMGVGVSDYFDALLAPGIPREAISQLLAAALHASAAGRCDLPDLPELSGLRGGAAPAGWSATCWPGPPCPVLPLVPAPAVPKGMQRDLRQARNRAERAGGWHIVRADAPRLPMVLGALVALHGLRWRGRGEAGVLADPGVLAFHQAAAPDLLAAGLLRLEALQLRGQWAAAIYALLGPGRIYFYLSGFDPACAFESPGTILLGHMIEAAAAEGRTEAHFLRGPERYKYAWGGVDRLNAGRSFTRA